MDDALASIPEPYAGLNVHSADIFPFSCTKCQRRFTDLQDFISRTTPLFHSSGLLARDDANGGAIVLLMRNCLCGTSLALRCRDRRATTVRGVQRRSRFDTLVALLVEVGVAPEQARGEIRRLLSATEV